MKIQDKQLWQRALALHADAIVMDSHSDLPMRILDDGVQIGIERAHGHQDLVRMRKGGQNVQFMAIYVAVPYDGNGAFRRMLSMTEALLDAINRNPEQVVLARTEQEIRAAVADGKIVFVLALEGGHALEGRLDMLHYCQRLGMRYVTLTHIATNALADASTDAARWGGLSPFGREVIIEMNKLGMMIDVSHISDRAFWQVLELSTAPPFASHSSCRSLAPTERNMDDVMISAMAEKDGVIMINFGNVFLHRQWAARLSIILAIIMKEHGGDFGAWDGIWQRMTETNPLPPVGVDSLLDHITHVADLCGTAFVGLGSDYEGIDHVPEDIGHAGLLPHITYGLLERGMNEKEIRCILGENALRVMRAAEKAAETGR